METARRRRCRQALVDTVAAWLAEEAAAAAFDPPDGGADDRIGPARPVTPA